MPGDRPADRLDESQRLKLDNIVASYRMEQQVLTADEIDILALYLLGEISSDESRARMAALRP